MAQVTMEPPKRLRTSIDVEEAIKNLYAVERLQVFLFIGNEEAGSCWLFRLPASKGSKMARLDDEGNLHIYNLHACQLMLKDGEIWP
jgi:hypothetical protein